MKWLFLICALALGCTAEVSDGDMQNTQKLTGWSQGDELGYHGTGPVCQAGPFPYANEFTVQFQVNGVFANGDIPNPVAEISWTVAGNTTKRTVAAGNGASVSGVAQSFDVRVRDETVPSGSPPTGTYQVVIKVTPGSRPSLSQPATYLTNGGDGNFNGTGTGGLGYVLLNATGETVTLQIPRFAGVISVFTTASKVPVGVITEADIQASIGGPTSGANAKSFDPRESTWIPIGATASTLTFINNTASNTPVLYSFTWGIDG